jgi:hypothetical protein
MLVSERSSLRSHPINVFRSSAGKLQVSLSDSARETYGDNELAGVAACDAGRLVNASSLMPTTSFYNQAWPRGLPESAAGAEESLSTVAPMQI